MTTLDYDSDQYPTLVEGKLKEICKSFFLGQYDRKGPIAKQIKQIEHYSTANDGRVTIKLTWGNTIRFRD